MQQRKYYSRAPITEAVIFETKLAEVTESILLVLNKCQKYLEYLENAGEIDYNPVLPKRSDRVRVRAQFKGRRKPQPYFIDEE